MLHIVFKKDQTGTLIWKSILKQAGNICEDMVLDSSNSFMQVNFHWQWNFFAMKGKVIAGLSGVKCSYSGVHVHLPHFLSLARKGENMTLVFNVFAENCFRKRNSNYLGKVFHWNHRSDFSSLGPLLFFPLSSYN